MRGALLVSVFVLVAVVVAPAAAGLETVSGSVTRVETLAADDHDAYEIQTGGKTVQIEVTVTGSDVDFYVMIRSEYDKYTNPDATGMYVVADKENTRSFSYSLSRSGLVFVVDNQYWTETGALPTGAVTYTLDITYGAGTSFGAAVGVLLFFAILIAIVVVAVVVARRRRATPSPAPIPPWAGSMSAPPAAEPVPLGFAAPGAAVTAVPEEPAPGAVIPAEAPCPSCRKPLRAGAAFCTSCGTRIG